MKRPWLVRFWLSAFQDSDATERYWVKRTHVDDPRGVEAKLAELDEKREREAPVAMAYVMSVLTVAVPLGGLIWWLVAA